MDHSDVAIDKMLRQLTEDSDVITNVLDICNLERQNTLQSQKSALAYYHAEIAEIEASFNPESYNLIKEQVDHNVLRHLRIERDSEQYKKLENSNKGNQGKVLQNIEELKLLSCDNHEVKAAPTFEEKTKIRLKMFDFMDESRMEETRLELEYEQAIKHNEIKLADEIAEALFILQKENSELLNNMINDYRPSAFTGKAISHDSDYQEMLRNIAFLEGDAPGTLSSTMSKHIKKK